MRASLRRANAEFSMRSGVILILLSMSLTPIGDALSKQLGQSQSPIFIVFLRYFTAGMIALLLARIGGIRVSLPDRGRAGLFIRTALVIGAMSMLIAALSIMLPAVVRQQGVAFFCENGTIEWLQFSLLGASGSIAAVTTAYLVLFPRSHVTVLYFFFLIGVINVPAPR